MPAAQAMMTPASRRAELDPWDLLGHCSGPFPGDVVAEQAWHDRQQRIAACLAMTL